jgi:hypothetical protein
MEKISELLELRPPKDRFRDQLFWLVDIINACKNTNNRTLIEEAKLMEKALGDLGTFLETGNSQELNKAILYVEQFSRIVKAAVAGNKPEFNVFLSYSTEDANFFRIKDIAKNLEAHPDISKVFYWEKDSGQNIIEYMETNLEKSSVFVLFCSNNSGRSKSVKLERSAAIQLCQEERMRILPVFNEPSEIPLLIKPFLGVKFDPENYEEFFQNLRFEIFRN